MNIGVGLPTSTAGISGQLLVDWARRADAGPFSSLGVVDRVAYQNYEPFTALGAAAAVTQRVRLATMVVIAPLRNTAILAKQAASIHALSGGRFTLGIGVSHRATMEAMLGLTLDEPLAVMREYVAVLRGALGAGADFEGRHFRVRWSLALPEHARGLVVFAHGSGSSRWSTRNRFVAESLQRAGLATLLLDLLTPGEERRDAISGHIRFDIGLLAARLIAATVWAASEAEGPQEPRRQITSVKKKFPVSRPAPSARFHDFIIHVRRTRL